MARITKDQMVVAHAAQLAQLKAEHAKVLAEAEARLASQNLHYESEVASLKSERDALAARVTNSVDEFRKLREELARVKEQLAAKPPVVIRRVQVPAGTAVVTRFMKGGVEYERTRIGNKATVRQVSPA